MLIENKCGYPIENCKMHELIMNQYNEITRLKAVNAELVRALENLANQTVINEYNGHCFTAARKAIAKATSTETEIERDIRTAGQSNNQSRGNL